MVKAKTNQNQVPIEFDALYSPILKFKKRLQLKVKELNPNKDIHNFSLLHYTTFVMVHFYKQLGLGIIKILNVREIIEQVISKNSYELLYRNLAKLSSFIDAFAKELNTTYKPYVYIALYEASLDSKIYWQIHRDINIYGFVEFRSFDSEVISNLKQYYHISLQILEDLELSPKEQPVIDKTIKLKYLQAKF